MYEAAGNAPASGSRFSGATVLVTGGTGSFGNAVSRRLLQEGATQVRVFSRDEVKQDEMRQSVADPRLRFQIGDVRDRASLDRAMVGVDYVFHAAALKQVPTCEFFPQEAVATNVLGSENVFRAADRAGVKSLVCLSTDKAVYPVSAMGMSKALMEKHARAFALEGSSQTVVSIVRYGNVLFSRGSVIPLFMRQIRDHQPLTITDPEMTRFLLPMSECIDLVLLAFERAAPGDILVRKAAAASVGSIARAVAEIMGAEPETRVIGTRQAEKRFETLLSQSEVAAAETWEETFRVPMDGRDLGYGDSPVESELAAKFEDYTSDNARQLTHAETVDMIRRIPEVRAQL